MKKINILLSAMLILILTACGGGGGGGTSGTTTSDSSGGAASSGTVSNGSVTYSGVTEQADLNESSSREFGNNSMLGYESTASSLGSVRSDESKKEYAGLPSSILLMTKDIINETTNIDLNSRAVTTNSSTVSGSCGGSATVSMTVDDTAETVDFEIAYNNFCYAGITNDGSVSISANYSGSSVSWSSLDSVELRYDQFQMEISNTSYIANGTINISIGATSETVILNITMDSPSDNNTIYLENMRCSIYKSPGYYTYQDTIYGYSSSLYLSGRIYMSDYGYVTVSTEEMVYINSYGNYIGGKILMNGSDGKSVLMEYSPNSADSLTADLDGDGLYETNL